VANLRSAKSLLRKTFWVGEQRAHFSSADKEAAMHSLRLLAAITAPLAMVAGACSGTRGPAPASISSTDSRPCATNSTVEGNVWVGRAFRSFQEYPAARKSDAFDRVVATVAARGWQINATNKDSGIIAASQQAAWGQGQAAPLNVVIKETAGGGIRIDVVFQTLGGMVLSLDTVREELCNILQSAA
jgi:hypothetical protein